MNSLGFLCNRVILFWELWKYHHCSPISTSPARPEFMEDRVSQVLVVAGS